MSYVLPTLVGLALLCGAGTVFYYLSLLVGKLFNCSVEESGKPIQLMVGAFVLVCGGLILFCLLVMAYNFGNYILDGISWRH